MDIAQLPNLPEKTSESSESSDSESESKENSGRSDRTREGAESVWDGGGRIPSSCVSSIISLSERSQRYVITRRQSGVCARLEADERQQPQAESGLAGNMAALYTEQLRTRPQTELKLTSVRTVIVLRGRGGAGLRAARRPNTFFLHVCRQAC